MRILGICGSLRRGSHNRKLLRAAAASLPPGVQLEPWDDIASLPIFDEDLEAEAPAPVQQLRAAIDAADAVLIATPEYGASVPGGLKNLIDWMSRPYPDNVLRGKPVLVIGASTGLFGAVWAQAEVRKSVRHAGAHVIDDELPVGSAHSAFNGDNTLINAELSEKLGDLLADLVREIDAPIERDALAAAYRRVA
jgi:chromate reductase, NAD(P)H dehydrogenase (quinone)